MHTPWAVSSTSTPEELQYVHTRSIQPMTTNMMPFLVRKICPPSLAWKGASIFGEYIWNRMVESGQEDNLLARIEYIGCSKVEWECHGMVIAVWLAWNSGHWNVPFWVSLCSGTGPGEREVEGAITGKSVIRASDKQGGVNGGVSDNSTS